MALEPATPVGLFVFNSGHTVGKETIGDVSLPESLIRSMKKLPHKANGMGRSDGDTFVISRSKKLGHFW
jgi:hypothetical protein